MEHVESLPRLKMLRLGGASITNAGLQHLAILTDLEDLSLGRTQVSDAGLEHIQGLASTARRQATSPGSSGHQLTQTLPRVYSPTVSRLPSTPGTPTGRLLAAC